MIAGVCLHLCDHWLSVITGACQCFTVIVGACLSVRSCFAGDGEEADGGARRRAGPEAEQEAAGDGAVGAETGGGYTQPPPDGRAYPPPRSRR